MGRRVLITGLGTFWGGRVAQALEEDRDVELIVGLDTAEPQFELRRTEFIRSDENYSILSRIVRATGVDTVLHTFLVLDPSQVRSGTMHEINVIGTMNLFAAASAPQSTVRQVVVKSATLVYGASREDPAWFTEETPRSHPPRSSVERSLLEVEGYVSDFATDRPDVKVALLRFANVLGPDIITPFSRALTLPLVPSIGGFDPSMQFVHEDDVVRSILFVMRKQLNGVYNVAADGRLPWNAIAALAGRRTFALPPVRSSLLAPPLRRIGVSLELIDLLRYGRGVDNRRLKEAGFSYLYTTADAVEAFARGVPERPSAGETGLPLSHTARRARPLG